MKKKTRLPTATPIPTTNSGRITAERQDGHAMKTTRSRREFRRAQRSIPGGVNSPVRAFGAVGGTPRFIAAADGRPRPGRRWQRVHRLRRLVGPDDPRPRASRGGRAPSDARCEARDELRGTDAAGDASWPSACARLPSHRAAPPRRSSGTEATMSALRARAGRRRAGRDPQVRRLLPRPRGRASWSRAGSGVATLGDPELAGWIPKATADLTLVRPTTTSLRRSPPSSAAGDDDRGRHRRAGGGQHGRRAAGAGIPRGSARSLRRVRGALLSSTR